MGDYNELSALLRCERMPGGCLGLLPSVERLGASDACTNNTTPNPGAFARRGFPPHSPSRGQLGSAKRGLLRRPGPLEPDDVGTHILARKGSAYVLEKAPSAGSRKGRSTLAHREERY